MLGKVRTALKFMTYGLIVGILFAPESGEQTRKHIKDWASSSVRGVFGNSQNA